MNTPSSSPLHTSLSRLRPLYTDIILHCRTQAFPVHRLILDAHSPDVFSKSLSGWSRDSQAANLEIGDAQSDAVKAMLDFFYPGTYEVPEFQSPLGFHLEVYQFADRYQYRALLDESLGRFGTACRSDSWDTSDLIQVARDIESVELGNKEALRAVVLETMKAKLETLLLNHEFADLLSDLQSLSLALLKSLGREGAVVLLSKGQRRRQKASNREEGYAGGQKTRWSSPEAEVSRR